MKPILPREMLWTDKKTMDEFFELEPLNKELYEEFTALQGEPFSVNEDAVKVFNEVYYQLTRMMFEHPMPSDTERYETDIKANLGWNHSAALVMTMIYFIRTLNANCIISLNRFFFNNIEETYGESMYWQKFQHRLKRLKSNMVGMKYKFRPLPRPVSYFTDVYLNWNIITRRYDLGAIEYVLNLWISPLERKTIAEMIIESMSYGGINHPNGLECEQVRRFVAAFLDINPFSEDASILDRIQGDKPEEILKPKMQQQLELASLIDLQEWNGKPLIIKIGNAEINVNSGGNFIGKEIKYETQG